MSYLDSAIKMVNVKKALAMLGLLLVSGLAYASTSSGSYPELQQALDDIVAIIEGPLGQIVIILAFVWGIFQVLQQDWIKVLGAFLSGIALINVNEIVAGIFGASVTEMAAPVAGTVVGLIPNVITAVPSLM
jgi:type IV secretory pathway VirB2 component (pilin)